jgi:hypothetical protein
MARNSASGPCCHDDIGSDGRRGAEADASHCARPVAALPVRHPRGSQIEDRGLKDTVGFMRAQVRRASRWGTAFLTASALFTLGVACSEQEDSAQDPGTEVPGNQIVEGACEIADGADAPDSLEQIGCTKDFEALASEPLDTSLPGARSGKVVLDMFDGDKVHFQNSQKFQVHYEFISEHLSGDPLPIVPELAQFNQTEYYAAESDRRFLLGTVTHYEGPDVWALELAPYDTSTASMIERLYEAVAEKAFFGPGLRFHPASEPLAKEAAKLETVPVITTNELYAQISYQPLTLATSMGRLRFAHAADLEEEYLSYEDIVVLDQAPNDISVVMGVITEEFQTPLSHINVLSQNRHTPNMGLRGALTNEKLLALEGKWVELTVGATDWSIREVTAEEAKEFTAAHKPPPVTLPAMNLEVTGLFDIEDITPESDDVSLRDVIKESVLAFGGKAAQYSILAKTDDVPIKKAFAVPIYYYDQFMNQNGFYDEVEAFLADEEFMNNSDVRDQRLAELRAEMAVAPVDEEFQALLRDKMEQDYPGQTMRFRTSTNSEDLEGFPCAGCYESQTGDPENWDDVLDAIRTTWASIWLYRTFEERTFYGIDHRSVGMALLVHTNFPDEEANGVAVTNNPYDPSGLEPAFYVNVQWGGEAEVVHPPAGITSDQFIYYFYNANQPVTFVAHSNLVEEGETVLSAAQTYELGKALDAIHERFSAAYGPKAGNDGWYAMDVEFKFDDAADPSKPPALYVKQARPYPGRGE